MVSSFNLQPKSSSPLRRSSIARQYWETNLLFARLSAISWHYSPTYSHRAGFPSFSVQTEMHLMLRSYPSRAVKWGAVQTLRPLLVASPSIEFCAGHPLPLASHITRSYAVKKKSTFSSSQLKVILKEYGPVAIVFHTVMSLGSLGGFYVLVNR